MKKPKVKETAPSGRITYDADSILESDNAQKHLKNAQKHLKSKVQYVGSKNMIDFDIIPATDMYKITKDGSLRAKKLIKHILGEMIEEASRGGVCTHHSISDITSDSQLWKMFIKDLKSKGYRVEEKEDRRPTFSLYIIYWELDKI